MYGRYSTKGKEMKNPSIINYFKKLFATNTTNNDLEIEEKKILEWENTLPENNSTIYKIMKTNIPNDAYNYEKKLKINFKSKIINFDASNNEFKNKESKNLIDIILAENEAKNDYVLVLGPSEETIEWDK
jgi:hypothetical protein